MKDDVCYFRSIVSYILKQSRKRPAYRTYSCLEPVVCVCTTMPQCTHVKRASGGLTTSLAAPRLRQDLLLRLVDRVPLAVVPALDAVDNRRRVVHEERREPGTLRIDALSFVKLTARAILLFETKGDLSDSGANRVRKALLFWGKLRREKLIWVWSVERERAAHCCREAAASADGEPRHLLAAALLAHAHRRTRSALCQLLKSINSGCGTRAIPVISVPFYAQPSFTPSEVFSSNRKSYVCKCVRD